TSQVDDLLDEVNKRTAMGLRSLVGALTKRQAEDLTDYMQGLGVRARYLHSDIATLERMAIINELREGLFDALIGINLLREGLDIPEVGLVAILNADSEGFLRSETALIQTSGRAARNSQGLVVLYADRITGSMQRAMDEMNRRRQLQIDHNTLHGITPISVQKGISNALAFALDKDDERKVDEFAHLATEGIERLIGEYDAKMKAAAAELDFETAAQWRDKIKKLRLLEMI
ncbi:MAG: helicase-related protein, partial [Nitrospinota bacterium]|nr:helicase-related protein [Nitrospinota bacterium]